MSALRLVHSLAAQARPADPFAASREHFEQVPDFYEVRRQQGKGVPAPEPPSLMVITADAKGVVMHKQDLRPETRKAAERKKRSKLRTRLSRGRSDTASAWQR